jgi:aminopeptidase N
MALAHSTSVKPINYNLSLYNLEFLGKWSYQGTVKIDLDIKKSAKEIVLNTHQLVLHSAELTTEQSKTEQALKSSGISYDEANQRATITFGQEFPVSSKAVLEIKFQGVMNDVSITTTFDQC